MRDLLAVVDATYKDSLDQLTLHRMPGALPFAGKFRLIDFTLSNLRNSHITNVAIFPYGNYRSLQDHIGSGKRWDLDRRRDGLFILPPKNLYIMPGSMITFQRMYEHIEFFKRSNQEYAIITGSNIVWNIDFRDVLDAHIESECDITEIMYENIRLRTFVLSTKLLNEYILSYESLEYRTMIDVVEKAPNLKVNIYKHKTYTRTITDSFNYLKSNLDMLRFDIGKEIFRIDRPVYSKHKTAPPAKYLKNAKVSNSMVSAGAIIDGTVINSIIGRDVIVKKGAIIKNSFVMNNCFIEEGSHVEYGILDKQTVIKTGTLLTGTLHNPYVTQKEQVVTNFKKLNVLMVASESYPFIKTGGLADIIGSLSRNLVRQGIDVTVIIPYYKKIKNTFTESIKSEYTKEIMYGEERYKVRIYSYRYKKVKYYFVDNFDFLDTENAYGYDNDLERFAFFNKTVVEMLDDFKPFDLIHIHDWHTSLIPILLHNSKYKDVTTLLTLHNVDYQGKGSSKVIKDLGIKNFIFREPTINALEIGINTATKISTVSPTYKEELKYEYFGRNLTHTITKRERDFYGLLNGISSSWNPVNDRLIYENYSWSTFENKLKNKFYLQEQMNLEVGEEYFLMGMVTRIAEQKGFDILIPALRRFLKENELVQFVLLGTGTKKYIDELLEIEKEFPKQVKLNIGYDSYVPNHIYAGCDVFLMPSRFEPCGLGQMISMKYGTLPIVRKTGGLNDTVSNYDHLTHKGNGFVFNNYDSNDLGIALNIAYNTFASNKETFRKLVKRAMKEDNSIKNAALRYVELYRAITKK
jgi:starch synthase